jgi:hypothetical protein
MILPIGIAPDYLIPAKLQGEPATGRQYVLSVATGGSVKAEGLGDGLP